MSTKTKHRPETDSPKPQKKSAARTVPELTSTELIKVEPDNLGLCFPVVGIGASAGGLEALDELFKHMPNDTGMAFVVVTHQHPGHASLLPELLGKIADIQVQVAADGMKIEPNHVYVSPPGCSLAILSNVLQLMETEKKGAPHLPIDYFLRSLAADQKDSAICIILSGTGTDGTLGLRAIKGESGMVMVQNAESAKYSGMPSSAIATGLADFVLPAPEMHKQLTAYARGPYLAMRHDERPLDLSLPMQKIFILLRARTGHDFSAYKPNTIRRRIERRMTLHEIKGPAKYVLYLQENPHELDILFKELLISVTNFFRDPDAFDVLIKSALPRLLMSRTDLHTFRIWVPGCASGEEVFSLAILMSECLESVKQHNDVQIFGTDLDNAAIGISRIGLYPEGIFSDVTAQRLDRYFVRKDNSYLIRKEIREMTVFALQNVIKDPPFTKLDLISCRNLLIYLNADLQRRLLPLFHYALKPGGLLFLGSSESIGTFGDLFEVVDKKWKIYRRKENTAGTHALLEFSAQPMRTGLQQHPLTASGSMQESSTVGSVNRLLLARFAPASVVVNERGDIVFIHGRTGAYLEPAAGQPRLNILDMAREGLEPSLVSALRQANTQDTEVTRQGVRVRTTSSEYSLVKVSVMKIQEPENVRGLLLVTFLPSPVIVKSSPGIGRAISKREVSRVEELDRELSSTRESLQTTIEELETSNEELKSSNEELQSTNEELQSTNEEIETSKEEMQSLNEELTTVNSEMQSKVEDLSRTNDDMQNLLNSTEVATIFLDNELNIKRYTEQARQLVHLIHTDIGRPLGHLVTNLIYDRMVPDSREVLRTLVFKLAEVQTHDDRWYLMRIMPYRTATNIIDGVVITFVDINTVKAAEKSLLRSKVFLDGPDPVVLLDVPGRIIDVNDEAMRTYGWSRQELLGQSVALLVPESGNDNVHEQLRCCLSGDLNRNIECVQVTKAGKTMVGSVTFSLLTDERGGPFCIAMQTKFTNS